MTTAPPASSSLQVIERSPSNTRSRPTVSAEQSELFSRYPLFFRAVAAGDAPPSNIGNFGIQCGSGWYPLIEDAAAQIEHELRHMWSSQVAHWENIAAIERALLMEQADSVYPLLPVCTDIRQVNGALVIVVVPGIVCDCDSAQWLHLIDIVKKIKEQSYSVCESCGSPGKMRKTYWHHVYCDSCIAPIGDIEQQDL